MATRNFTRIPIITNKNYKANGLKSYAYALHKYGIGPTREGPYLVTNRIHQQGKFGPGKALGGHARVQKHVLQKRVAVAADSGSTETGDVPAEDIQNDSLYLCEVGIGTPAQKLRLDFDTGSADLWVWSTSLPSNVQSQGKSSNHAIFDPSKSSTFKKSDGSTWQIQYGDQSSASGDVGTDTIDLGGLKVENQAIELASKLSDQFVQGEGDGLLGLAWGSINTVKPEAVNTPVENMIAQEDIPKDAELFTAYLGSTKDTSEADKGESFYTFGYIDQDVLKAAGVDTPFYVDIDNSQGFWQFTSTSASVNGQTIQRSGNTAIADTGTTLALVADDVVDAIYKAIPGAKYDSQNQGYVFPSSVTADQLPEVSFAVGEKLFVVQKEDLAFADAGNGFVYGGIQSRGDMTFDILGDTFLKGIYAIFDQGNKRFGAVQRKEKEQNVSVPSGSS
ncbi:Peptidase A1 [Lasiodiplodia theobromae]|uniref:Aspergillopepsin-1 n=1 Tax=Lasiodiplodia hormozganensis TaxID=869390 RepID=A0AA40CJ62_9PEZI|nr:Aspartic endopeptidase [Lasiodiplodia theobromae]KAF4541128.1 Aspartic endopeptidase [Lasiodiplodia theobromae]KAF9632338.1 Peptidase A1 [Lasiodiplodia theobromae]KAK0640372.1 Aspergillopepsin-1 [Lasiodiplodia hormozganensis]